MLFEGRVGASYRGAGAVLPPRLDDTGAVALLSHGKYTDAVLRGGVYIGANAFGTAVTTQAGLSATTPALTLYNPVGSGVLGVVLSVGINITAAPAAAAVFCLAHNAKNATAPASTTNGTMINAQVGSANTPKVQCYRVATLAAAPVANLMLGGTTGAAAISGLVQTFDIDGLLVIEEGVAISVQASSAAAILCHFVWEEIMKP